MVLPKNPDLELASRSHCFDRVQKKIQKQLLELRFLNGDNRARIVTLKVSGCPSLLHLGAEQEKCVLDRHSYVYAANLLWGCRRDAAKSAHEIIYPGDLLDDDLRKVLAKIDVGESLRQELGKCSDRDKRILDLVSNA